MFSGEIGGVAAEKDGAEVAGEVGRRLNEWTEEMGITWYVCDGDTAIASKFVIGQAVKRVPSRVG